MTSSTNNHKFILQTPRVGDSSVGRLLSPPPAPLGYVGHKDVLTNSPENTEEKRNAGTSDERRAAPILDFPAMNTDSNGLLPPSCRRASSLLDSSSSSSGFRRRANSLDNTPPMPKISLRPRFTKHLTALPKSMPDVVSSLYLQDRHDKYGDCSCFDCRLSCTSTTIRDKEYDLHVNTSRSKKGEGEGDPPTHLRSHTYSGNDASAIFEAAMSLPTEVSSPRRSPPPEISPFPSPFDLFTFNRNLPPVLPPMNYSGTTMNSSNNQEVTKPVPRHQSVNTITNQNNHNHHASISPGNSLRSFVATPSQGGTTSCTISSSIASAFGTPPKGKSSPIASSLSDNGEKDLEWKRGDNCDDSEGHASSIAFDEATATAGNVPFFPTYDEDENLSQERFRDDDRSRPFPPFHEVHIKSGTLDQGNINNSRRD